MNRQLTIYLLACMLVLGGLILILDGSIWFRKSSDQPHTSGIIQVRPHEIMQVRVLRDYWNTFTITKNADGFWFLTEPTNDEVNIYMTQRLLETLTTLPMLKTIGFVTDDSERYHEYGLWEPSVQVYITSDEYEWLLLFGRETSDGEGVYVTRSDNDEIFITSKQAYDIIMTDGEMYRKSLDHEHGIFSEDTLPASFDSASDRNQPEVNPQN